jgi:hypothetical protein
VDDDRRRDADDAEEEEWVEKGHGRFLPQRRRGRGGAQRWRKEGSER